MIRIGARSTHVRTCIGTEIGRRDLDVGANNQVDLRRWILTINVAVGQRTQGSPLHDTVAGHIFQCSIHAKLWCHLTTEELRRRYPRFVDGAILHQCVKITGPTAHQIGGKCIDTSPRKIFRRLDCGIADRSQMLIPGLGIKIGVVNIDVGESTVSDDGSTSHRMSDEIGMH